jgi:hypothetical protein
MHDEHIKDVGTRIHIYASRDRLTDILTMMMRLLFYM